MYEPGVEVERKITREIERRRSVLVAARRERALPPRRVGKVTLEHAPVPPQDRAIAGSSILVRGNARPEDRFGAHVDGVVDRGGGREVIERGRMRVIHHRLLPGDDMEERRELCRWVIAQPARDLSPQMIDEEQIGCLENAICPDEHALRARERRHVDLQRDELAGEDTDHARVEERELEHLATAEAARIPEVDQHRPAQLTCDSLCLRNIGVPPNRAVFVRHGRHSDPCPWLGTTS